MKTRTTWVIALLTVSLTALADDDLWKQLQNDSHMVVFMRNAESSGNKDGANMLVWDATGECAGESTLTPSGREQAKAIGVAFAAHGIEPIVISSPMCRCKETARIAFGGFATDQGYGRVQLVTPRRKRYFKPLPLRFSANTGANSR